MNYESNKSTVKLPFAMGLLCTIISLHIYFGFVHPDVEELNSVKLSEYNVVIEEQEYRRRTERTLVISSAKKLFSIECDYLEFCEDLVAKINTGQPLIVMAQKETNSVYGIRNDSRIVLNYIDAVNYYEKGKNGAVVGIISMAFISFMLGLVNIRKNNQMNKDTATSNVDV